MSASASANTAPCSEGPSRGNDLRIPPWAEFFRYHGLWAPGVRLFRRVGFRAKAGFISAAFALPLMLLGAFFVSSQLAELRNVTLERQGAHVLTDVGFILYWLASGLQLLPDEWLYKDHSNPIVVAWNWSFAPLDLTASASGLIALWLARRASPMWSHVALLSLTLTFAAGLFALSFWSLRLDFDPTWWAPNGYLVIWPLLCLCGLLPQARQSAA